MRRSLVRYRAMAAVGVVALLASSLAAIGPAVGALLTIHGRVRVDQVGYSAVRPSGWNRRYRAVHPIDFNALRQPGSHRIRVGGVAGAVSPAFRVGTRRVLFGRLAADTVRFFQAQRDGADVPALLDRRPSHLTDRRATVYDTPVFTGDGGDVPAAPLEPVGGPVDVEGGWFDAASATTTCGGCPKPTTPSMSRRATPSTT